MELLRVTKRGHLPTALGPTLPSPRRGDRQDRGGGEWNCGKWHSAALTGRERGVGAGAVRPCGPTCTHRMDGAPVATELVPSLERSLPIGLMMLGDVYCTVTRG